MVIGADGRKRSHTFHRVLMRSAAKLHYAQAQDAADGRTDETTGPLLDHRDRAALCGLRGGQARARRAPAARPRPARAQDPAEAGRHASIASIVPPRLDAHRLIEEFMILANVAAAETLERARTPLIYRVHDEPAPEKIEALREFLATLDITSRQGPGDAARRLQQDPGARERHRARAAGQRGGAAHARRRPNTRPRTTAISGSTCAAMRTSPRRSAATPTWWCIAR